MSGSDSSSPNLELWGGIEATINRVGDVFHSQLARGGHDGRADDIERCVSLGIRALRYPILWERVSPFASAPPDWRASDAGLEVLRRANVRVIAGLLHHGSGPAYTDLTAPRFPLLFAEYAATVARRYPWIDHYTPVNEPLTTARFSGLYGLWYPHGRDERTFAQALLNQCRGTVLAMREIRKINPDARLVQTEDLGTTYSSAAVAYQAEFNNELRWLTWDLLAGTVSKTHFLWSWLTSTCEVREDDLAWFANNPCMPDLIGINHYVTSDRFLDERVHRYPNRFHGSNGRDQYADIEAARCLALPAGGLQAALGQAWQRYRQPLAVTEVHIDATRDDHLRWIKETWDATCAARADGVDVRAFTIWALFGSYDWNCLLTANHGYYEPGAFDVRVTPPAETAVAAAMRTLASGAALAHPILDGPGWWHRQDRFFCDAVQLNQVGSARSFRPAPREPRPILISGASGALGRAFARICARRGLGYRLIDRREMDIVDETSVGEAMTRYAPWAVVNAAGYVNIDQAETDAAVCNRANVTGCENLAAACARAGIPLVVFSSDMVFDGARAAPYTETDPTAPLNVYGRSKVDAEARVLARHRDALIVRTSSFFGPWDTSNFIATVLEALSQGRAVPTASDVTVSPTYVPHLVDATLDLMIDGATGIWHLSNEQALTWSEFATLAAERAGIGAALVHARPQAEMSWNAIRPAYSALGSERSRGRMPSLEQALRQYFNERELPAARSRIAA